MKWLSKYFFLQAVSLARTNLFKKLDEKNNSRVRRPLGEITHMHVPQNLEESLIMECEESFPFLSDHSSLLWMNCITTQTRVFKLKNASKNCQILRVIIIGEKFSIGESGITSLEMKFQPEEVKKVINNAQSRKFLSEFLETFSHLWVRWINNVNCN